MKYQNIPIQDRITIKALILAKSEHIEAYKGLKYLWKWFGFKYAVEEYIDLYYSK